jgi:hypothetical protein
MSATATLKAELLGRDLKYLSDMRLKKAVSKQVRRDSWEGS